MRIMLIGTTTHLWHGLCSPHIAIAPSLLWVRPRIRYWQSPTPTSHVKRGKPHDGVPHIDARSARTHGKGPW